MTRGYFTVMLMARHVARGGSVVIPTLEISEDDFWRRLRARSLTGIYGPAMVFEQEETKMENLDESKVYWADHLPTHELPDTGPKVFTPGEVWAWRTGNDVKGAVARILRHADGDYFDCEVLAGTGANFVAQNSTAARHAVKIADAPGQLLKISEPRKRYVEVTEKIMVKAEAHMRAGRGGAFSQVFVPMDDFEAMREYFGGEPVIVQTCIGPMSVHPVNPDGATFSD